MKIIQDGGIENLVIAAFLQGAKMHASAISRLIHQKKWKHLSAK